MYTRYSRGIVAQGHDAQGSMHDDLSRGIISVFVMFCMYVCYNLG